MGTVSYAWIGAVLFGIGWFLAILAKPRKVVISGAILILLGYLVTTRSYQLGQAESNQKLDTANEQLTDVRSKLSPFLAIASERKYTGGENERLRKLLSDMSKAQSDIDTIKKYSDVAQLNPLGSIFELGHGPIAVSSPISRILEGTYQEKADHELEMSTTADAEKKYREVAEKFPTFPYSYVYISGCLEARNDPAWREYAQKAVDIFEKTTAIAGHNENHDKLLKFLKQKLRRENERLRRRASALESGSLETIVKQYSDVAQLDPLGKPFEPISRILELDPEI